MLGVSSLRWRVFCMPFASLDTSTRTTFCCCKSIPSSCFDRIDRVDWLDWIDWLSLAYWFDWALGLVNKFLFSYGDCLGFLHIKGHTQKNIQANFIFGISIFKSLKEYKNLIVTYGTQCKRLQ